MISQSVAHKSHLASNGLDGFYVPFDEGYGRLITSTEVSD